MLFAVSNVMCSIAHVESGKGLRMLPLVLKITKGVYYSVLIIITEKVHPGVVFTAGFCFCNVLGNVKKSRVSE